MKVDFHQLLSFPDGATIQWVNDESNNNKVLGKRAFLFKLNGPQIVK